MSTLSVPEVSAPPRRRRTLPLEWAGVSLVFVLLTLLYTDPLWRHPGTFLVEPGDALGNTAISWWMSRHFLSGHLAGIWNLPPYFYPAPRPITFNDPQIGTSLLGLPVFAATGNAVLAFNFVLLVSMPLCALGAYALARHVTGSRAGAVFAGVVWGFGVWHQAHQGHQQLLSLECLPFLLLALHRYGETRRKRFLFALFGLWLTQEYLSEYWGMYLLLLITPFALMLLRMTYRLAWRDVARAGVAAGLAVAAWLPLQAAFLLSAAHGVHHSLEGILRWDADLCDYLPPPGTWLWGAWGYRHVNPLMNASGGEFFVSPGMVALTLAGVGVAGLLRRSDQLETASSGPPRVRWQALILAALLLAVWLALHKMLAVHAGASVKREVLANTLGACLVWGIAAGVWAWASTLPPVAAWARGARLRWADWRSPLLPYVALAALAAVWSCGFLVNIHGVTVAPGVHGLAVLLPGTRSFRVLARMGIFADLALAVLAAAALASLLRRSLFVGAWKRGLVVAALCALALAENTLRPSAFSFSRDWRPPSRAADRWLAAQPPGAVVELPLTGDYLEGGRMWYQMTFQKPMRNGMGTFMPLDMVQDVQTLKTPGSSAAVARLRVLGIRYVLLDRHQTWLPGQIVDPATLPHLPASLPPPYVLRYTDPDVKVYALSSP